MSNYPSPLATFYKWERETPNKVYFNQPLPGGRKTFTFKEAGEQIRRMAAALKAMNLPAGSRIALISKNCAHWIMTDLAIMMSGHVSVPVYPNIKAETVNYILTHSEAQVLFVGKLDDWASMKPGVPDAVHCINFPSYYGSDPDYDNWDDIVAQHEPLSGDIDREPEDLITIIYTSGTTGKPKGVMHNLNAFGFAATNALSIFPLDSAPEHRFFSYLPLSHIAERLLVGLGGLYTGSTVYFAQSLDTFAQDLQYANPTIFLGVPRIWTKFQMKILEKMPQKRLNLLLKIPFISTLVKRKIRKGLGLDNAVYALTGAAPTPPSLIKWFQKLGLNIHEAYGMTENCAYSHVTRKDQIRYGSTGQAQPKCEVLISQKPENEGEILVKSEASMIGYYKMPEKTAQTFMDGYLRTGDKGAIDGDGFLRITGRVKDIFKTAKGKYVAPAPIELQLSTNTNIEQVCIVGVNLPQTMALIVLSEEAASQDPTSINASIADSVNELNPLLAKHEKIKKAVIVKEPWTVENGLLTPTLKIKRGPVEDKYSPNYQDWYYNGGLVVRQ